MSTSRLVQFAAGAFALAIVAACSAPTDTGQLRKVDVSALVVPNGQAAHVVVCKDGPTGTYGFTISGVSGGVTLNPANVTANQFSLIKDQCKDIATGEVGSSLTVQETSLAANTQFVRADIYNVSPLGVQDGVVDAVVGNPTGPLTFGDVGKVVVFVNEEVPSAQGRMTGGGAQIDVNGVRITRGFTIHCDIVLSNNLEINWSANGTENNWHIDKPLTKATCIDDPAYSEAPPRAPFNTFIGEGLGSLNGVDGSLVKFTFIDAGEPGKNDRAKIQIWNAQNVLVLDLPLTLLDHGNIQAHFDQPHGQHP